LADVRAMQAKLLKIRMKRKDAEISELEAIHQPAHPEMGESVRQKVVQQLQEITTQQEQLQGDLTAAQSQAREQLQVINEEYYTAKADLEAQLAFQLEELSKQSAQQSDSLRAAVKAKQAEVEAEQGYLSQMKESLLEKLTADTEAQELNDEIEREVSERSQRKLENLGNEEMALLEETRELRLW